MNNKDSNHKDDGNKVAPNMLSTEEMQQERSTPKFKDKAKLAQGLKQWFIARYPDRSAIELGTLAIPESSGMSNITFLFDLKSKKDGKTLIEPCVARIQPTDGALVFESYDLNLQYQAMQAFKGILPLPDLLGIENDLSFIGAPFYIMQRLDGIVPPDIPPLHMDGWVKNDCSPKQREQLWWNGLEAMCQLHNCPWREDFEFLHLATAAAAIDAKAANGGATDDSMIFLLHVQRYMRWAASDFDIKTYERCAQWLFEHKAKNEHCGFSWGDSRLGNLMYDADTLKVMGVFDWEMATYANPIKDLAWWCELDKTMSLGLGVPRLEGMPSEQESIRFWHKQTGLDASCYDYYKILSLFYFGLILIRTSVCADNPDPIGSNFVTPILENYLNEMGAAPLKS